MGEVWGRYGGGYGGDMGEMCLRGHRADGCQAPCKVCAGPHSYVNCDPAQLSEAQKEQLLKLRGQQGSQGAKPDSLRRGDTAKDKAKTKKLEQVREGWWAPTHVEAEVTPGKRASRAACRKQHRLTEHAGHLAALDVIASLKRTVRHPI